MLYDPCETTWQDVRDELSVEGLYEYIHEQPGQTKVDHRGVFAVVADYVYEIASPHCERGSEYHDDLCRDLIEEWEKADNAVYEFWNHSMGKDFADYQLILEYRELEDVIAKH